MKRLFPFIVCLFLTLSAFAQSNISRNVLDESSFNKNAPNFIVYSAPEMSVSMKDTTVHFYDNDGNPGYIVVEPHGACYWVYNMDNTGSGDATVYEFSSAASALKFIRTVFSLKYTIMEKVWWYFGNTESFYKRNNFFFKNNDAYKKALWKARTTASSEPADFNILIDIMSYTPYGINKTTSGVIAMDKYSDALRKKSVKTTGSLIKVPTAIVNSSIIRYGKNSESFGAQFSKVPDTAYTERFAVYLVKEDVLTSLMEQPVVILTMDNFKKDGGYFDYYDFTLCSRRSNIIALCPNGLDSLIKFEKSWTGDDRLFPFDADNDYIKTKLIEIWKY